MNPTFESVLAELKAKASRHDLGGDGTLTEYTVRLSEKQCWFLRRLALEAGLQVSQTNDCMAVARPSGHSFCMYVCRFDNRYRACGANLPLVNRITGYSGRWVEEAGK